jgi:AcrR family transcriptional regulator
MQKRDAKASKEAIVQNAIRLFSKKGYAGTSMDELASLCNLNKAMIFYYFKNKKGLYESVMHEILEEIYSTIVNKSRRYNSALDEIEEFIKVYAKFACSHPYLPSLLLKELSDSGAVIPEVLFSSMRKLFAHFSNILKRGGYKDEIPMVLYFMILGTLNLIVTTKSLRQKAAQLDDIGIDTCANCTIDEIGEYLSKKIKLMLKESE